jgi:hypothetical protein
VYFWMCVYHWHSLLLIHTCTTIDTCTSIVSSWIAQRPSKYKWYLLYSVGVKYMYPVHAFYQQLCAYFCIHVYKSNRGEIDV